MEFYPAGPSVSVVIRKERIEKYDVCSPARCGRQEKKDGGTVGNFGESFVHPFILFPLVCIHTTDEHPLRFVLLFFLLYFSFLSPGSTLFSLPKPPSRSRGISHDCETQIEKPRNVGDSTGMPAARRLCPSREQ